MEERLTDIEDGLYNPFEWSPTKTDVKIKDHKEKQAGKEPDVKKRTVTEEKTEKSETTHGKRKKQRKGEKKSGKKGNK